MSLQVFLCGEGLNFLCHCYPSPLAVALASLRGARRTGQCAACSSEGHLCDLISVHVLSGQDRKCRNTGDLWPEAWGVLSGLRWILLPGGWILPKPALWLFPGSESVRLTRNTNDFPLLQVFDVLTSIKDICQPPNANRPGWFQIWDDSSRIVFCFFGSASRSSISVWFGLV